MTTRTLMTAEEFAALPDEVPCRRDLVEGEVWTMAAASTKHGAIANELNWHVTTFVKQHRLGRVFTAETGFTLARNPDTVLGADVSFVRADRIPASGIPDRGFWEMVPDVVAEIVSPGDRAGEIARKRELYLRAGVLLVWIIDVPKRTIHVHRPGSEPRTLGEHDILDGEDVLPGFSLPLDSLWI